VILLWSIITLAMIALLPSLGDSSGGNGLDGLVPSDTPALRNELRSHELFDLPLLARTVLVQRDPDGLSVYAQARSVTNAVAVNRGRYDVQPLLGALPFSNTLGLFPASSEKNTTALTYLFFSPELTFGRQTRSARAYAEQHFGPADHVVGVTGSVPARGQQGRIISANLSTVELTTLAAIILIVGLNFRSPVAPAVGLCATAVAYVITLRAAGALAASFGITIPSELEPVVLALLLGIVTDYVVFFFSALRHELDTGADRLTATRAATAQFSPIVAAAGLAVAAGAGALLAATSVFFNALGPALVLTVLIGLAVAITLIPALMAILGRAIFWPTRLKASDHRPAPERSGASVSPRSVAAGARTRSPLHAIAHSRKVATLTATACTVGLLVASLPLLHMGLGVSFVDSLPGKNKVAQAAEAAQTGFAAGILSPTVVLLQDDDIASRRIELRRLGNLLESQAGVAGVLGPGDLPSRLDVGTLLAENRNAARFLVVLQDEPLGAAAVSSIDALSDRLPELLEQSGMQGARAGLAGDTATASYIVQQTREDVLRIALAALLANLVMLMLFLRALVASIYLLVASVLSLTATLGLTTWVFSLTNPGHGLTFYVPFTAAVLLLAFGSDYNIFGVGHVWDAARRQPLADAITTSMPRTTRAIMAAGLALAASFGLLATVPLLPFRQLAFAMSLGILLDVLVVRSLLMPALLTLVGPVSAWPGKRLHSPVQGDSGD